ncbi:terminase small subunit [Lysinibacillus sp. 1 U-2021]|uniref:terminase small subunit n=1 Tax=Lysinibacillus sp. 1 U-2021 TaxID=3039426 RepID=UPI00248088B5|nr:terminase small subunit [Lysinibacillus sp. 1 U-2021]WGT39040.1 terminase small subunit [Lysinibacillus sp. 1 U-2021]
MIEPKLTLKQQAFADFYIELGNAAEAYLKAYPNVKKEATAAGSRMLTNVSVKSYIDERMEGLKSQRIVSQKEINIGIGRCFDSIYQSFFYD